MANAKLRLVLPSLREKKRYLAFEVISKEKIRDASAVSNVIFEQSLRFLGKLGVAKAGMMMLNDKWNSELQRGILKVSHKHVEDVRAAFTFVSQIDGSDAIIRSLGVSGMLNKAEKKFLKSS